MLNSYVSIPLVQGSIIVKSFRWVAVRWWDFPWRCGTPPIGALWGKGLLEKSIYKCNLLTHEDVLCPASWPGTVRWTRQFVGSSGRDQDCTWVRRCCLGVFQTRFRLTKGTSNVDPLGYVPGRHRFLGRILITTGWTRDEGATMWFLVPGIVSYTELHLENIWKHSVPFFFLNGNCGCIWRWISSCCIWNVSGKFTWFNDWCYLVFQVQYNFQSLWTDNKRPVDSRCIILANPRPSLGIACWIDIGRWAAGRFLFFFWLEILLGSWLQIRWATIIIRQLCRYYLQIWLEIYVAYTFLVGVLLTSGGKGETVRFAS